MNKKSVYLAIDPGDTLGWAEFDENGKLIGMGQEDQHNFTEFITEKLHSDLKHVIVENFLLFTGKANALSRNSRARKLSTSKMIGKIEIMADMRSVPITLQPNNCYSIGAMWGGFEIPKNHSISHQYVAAAHGIYWLQQNGVRAPGMAIKEN